MTEAIARRRCLPPGGHIAMQPMRDGWPVRTVLWPATPGGPGSILFINGRGDFLEKYAETFHDLIAAGWGVASFDWRGQGLSGRIGASPPGVSPGLGETEFDARADDLDRLVQWAAAELPGPLHAMAHSMGGHMLLRHLAADGRAFRRAVLLSPMLGILAKPLGPRWARRLAGVMSRMGRADHYVTGGGPYVIGAAGSYRQTLLTGCADRYLDEGWWVAENPALALGSVTWGWLDAAFRSLDALVTPRALAGVTTPVLTLIPVVDGLVDNVATRQAVPLLTSARLQEYPGAAHELLRETPKIRLKVLAEALEFLETGA